MFTGRDDTYNIAITLQLHKYGQFPLRNTDEIQQPFPIMTRLGSTNKVVQPKKKKRKKEKWREGEANAAGSFSF